MDDGEEQAGECRDCNIRTTYHILSMRIAHTEWHAEREAKIYVPDGSKNETFRSTSILYKFHFAFVTSSIDGLWDSFWYSMPYAVTETR